MMRWFRLLTPDYQCLWSGSLCPFCGFLVFCLHNAVEPFALFLHSGFDSVCFSNVSMRTKHTFAIWSCIRIRGKVSRGVNRKEGNDQESIQLPNTFRSKTPKRMKDALKVMAPQ